MGGELTLQPHLQLADLAATELGHELTEGFSHPATDFTRQEVLTRLSHAKARS
jgi:hypothetical protein